MNPNLNKKRALSIEAEEPPSKKLCVSGLSPTQAEGAQLEIGMSVFAEQGDAIEPDGFWTENGFGDDFEKEFDAVFNGEGDDEDEGGAPEDDAPAGHAPDDKASEDDVPLAEISEERVAMAHLKSNRKATVLEPYCVLTAEKSSTASGSPASSSFNNLSTRSELYSSPETSRTSLVNETTPGPSDSIGPTPLKSHSTVKAADRKRSAKSPPEYLGLSFRDRRPLTDEHREMVRNAIDYTLQDLYNRTKVRLGTMDKEKGKAELYDTTLESFAYQYARAQHRFKQYHESKDLKAGINTTSKKYQKKINRRFEETELLFEVEGPWRAGFDDWKPPGATKATGIIDLSSD